MALNENDERVLLQQREAQRNAESNVRPLTSEEEGAVEEFMKDLLEENYEQEAHQSMLWEAKLAIIGNSGVPMCNETCALVEKIAALLLTRHLEGK